MAGAKQYKKAPITIANDVAAQLADNKYIEEVQAVSPGFINLTVSKKAAADYLNEMQAEEGLGVGKAKEPQTILIDYGGPNVGDG